MRLLRNKNRRLSKIFSENFEKNSEVVKKSLLVSKKMIPSVSKVFDYSIIIILTFFASKYYLNNISIFE